MIFSFNSNFIKKTISLFVFILIFTIIYSFFDNHHFGGFLKVLSSKYDKKQLKNIYIFQIFAKNKKFLQLHEFLKIPLFKYQNNIIISKERYNNSRALTMNEKELLFYIFSNNNLYLKLDEFLKIPIIIYVELNHDFNKKIINNFAKNNVFLYIFYRFYYSINIQSLLGSADIYPASNSLRFVVIIQVIVTLLILTN